MSTRQKCIFDGLMSLILVLLVGIGLLAPSETVGSSLLSEQEMRAVRGVGCDESCTGTSNCPIAQSGCLSGGCGGAPYHKEVQLRNNYPDCKPATGQNCPNQLYPCIRIDSYLNSNCTVQQTFICWISNTGC